MKKKIKIISLITVICLSSLAIIWLNSPNFADKPPNVVDVGSTSQISEGESRTFKIDVTDGDIYEEEYTILWTLDGETVGSSTMEYTYSPSLVSAGVHTLKVTVSDGKFTESRSWTVTVLEKVGMITINPIKNTAAL